MKNNEIAELDWNPFDSPGEIRTPILFRRHSKPVILDVKNLKQRSESVRARQDN